MRDFLKTCAALLAFFLVLFAIVCCISAAWHVGMLWAL